MPYELFTSRVGFDFESMSTKDSERYVQEFIERVPYRLTQLQGVVSSDRPWLADLSQDSLRALEPWFEGAVRTRPRTPSETTAIYSIAPGWFRDVPLDSELTIETISFAIDVGIYVAECLKRQYPERLHWRRENGGRRNMNYNRAVLGGFAKKIAFEPILIGTNLAYGVSRGRHRDLGELYDNWIANIE